MNNKGNLFLSVVVGIVILMVGILFISFVDGEVIRGQNSTYDYGGGVDGRLGINCGNSTDPNLTITDGGKLACLATEAVNPYFIVLILSVAGGAIVSRFIGKSKGE